MFKPTQCLKARLRLTTKQVNGGYYKGNRTGSMGKWGSRKGTYTIDWAKVRTYVAPDLSSFELTPFVTKTMEPMRDRYMKTVMKGEQEVEYPRSMSGQDYLEACWAENEDEYEYLKKQAIKDSQPSEGESEDSTASEAENHESTSQNDESTSQNEESTDQNDGGSRQSTSANPS